jgi:competence CoiA-like predicted nuclease
MECGKIVRRRGGKNRQDHFYHLKPDPACRQCQKSLHHLQVQWYLYHLLPDGECVLEKRFPEISRIADAVWEKKKLVFEVQCSPIPQAEVRQRNHDYQSLGYTVVWILHERRFHQRKISAVEEWLQGKPHYFTNFDAAGNGQIYDHLQVYERGMRRYCSEKSLINPAAPIFSGNRLIFEGDWSFRLIQNDTIALSVWEAFHQETRKRKAHWRRLGNSLLNWYMNVFNLVLEKCCG